MKHATDREFERARKLRRQRCTYQQIATKLGRSVAWAFVAARFAGKQHLRVDPARHQYMVEQFRNGRTLEDIGAEFSITRERVRQILVKNGITKMDGGMAMRSFRNIDDKIAKRIRYTEHRNATLMQRYGLTLDEYRSHVAQFGSRSKPKSPLTKFVIQRKSAKARGIGWELGFKEWWTIWQESGKWALRGRGQGYCMARIGDDGPYADGNIYITTSIENSSTGGQRKSDAMPLGVRKRNRKYSANRMLNGKKIWIGLYDTPESAHAAYISYAPFPEPGLMTP